MEVNSIKRIILLLLFLLLTPVNIAYAELDADYNAYKEKWDLLYEDKSDWLCFDYSIDYSRNHPGWGMVILSPSPAFRFQPHMANYKIEGNMLYIHEPQANLTYELEIVNGSLTVPFYEDFPDDFSSQWARPTYFHFIPNESGVLRTYYSLQDNRNEFFDYENVSTNDIAINTTITKFGQKTEIKVCENSSVDQTRKNNSIIENNTPIETVLLNNSIDGGKNINSESFAMRIIHFTKSLLGI